MILKLVLDIKHDMAGDRIHENNCYWIGFLKSTRLVSCEIECKQMLDIGHRTMMNLDNRAAGGWKSVSIYKLMLGKASKWDCQLSEWGLETWPFFAFWNISGTKFWNWIGTGTERNLILVRRNGTELVPNLIQRIGTDLDPKKMDRWPRM